MSAGQQFVNEMRKVYVISHTRLHEAHRHCPICNEGPFFTLEQMLDHVDEHTERLSSRSVMKHEAWIVLLEPSDYYKTHLDEVPDSLKGMRSIEEQEDELRTVEIGSDLLELTDLPKLRKRAVN